MRQSLPFDIQKVVDENAMKEFIKDCLACNNEEALAEKIMAFTNIHFLNKHIEPFSVNLGRLTYHKHLTQKDVSDMTNINECNIGRYLNGTKPKKNCIKLNLGLQLKSSERNQSDESYYYSDKLARLCDVNLYYEQLIYLLIDNMGCSRFDLNFVYEILTKGNKKD